MTKSAKDALKIDRKNGNAYWSDAIEKEINNVRVEFKILDDDKPVPIGYMLISCHMIFDTKMEDFCRKDHLVAGTHTTETPTTMTYASVVYSESVGLALMLTALNVLEVKCGDVENSYITAPINEKVWSILGPKLGADAGWKAIIFRA